MNTNRIVVDTRKTAIDVFEKLIEPVLKEKGISEELIEQMRKSCITWDEDFIMQLAQQNGIYPSWESINQYDFRRSSRVRIKEFLRDNQGMEFTYEDVAQKLQLIPNTAYQLLHRMIAKGGTGIRVKRGSQGMNANRYWWEKGVADNE
jgi:hypothetical protein